MKADLPPWVSRLSGRVQKSELVLNPNPLITSDGFQLRLQMQEAELEI